MRRGRGEQGGGGGGEGSMLLEGVSVCSTGEINFCITVLACLIRFKAGT